MKTLIVTSFAACLATGAFAARPELFTQPGTGKGYIAVVNSQSKVSESNLVEAAECVRRSCRYKFKFVKTADEAKDANMTITVIDDPAKPPLVAAPDPGWAVVNVAPLDDGLKSPTAKGKFYDSRVRKTFLRAFCYAAGAGGSGFPGNVLDCASVKDLDYARETLPVDAVGAANRHLGKRGMEVEVAATYRIACEEGWAPAPVTDAQKAIWDEIHKLPTNPLPLVKPTK